MDKTAREGTSVADLNTDIRFIKGEAENVLLARLKLADTARAVLKNGMTLIGCSAPEKM